jgi:hypothetical protein
LPQSDFFTCDRFGSALTALLQPANLTLASLWQLICSLIVPADLSPQFDCLLFFVVLFGVLLF